MFAAVCGFRGHVSAFCGPDKDAVRATLCRALVMGQEYYTFGTTQFDFLNRVDEILETAEDPYWLIADLIEPETVDFESVQSRSKEL